MFFVNVVKPNLHYENTQKEFAKVMQYTINLYRVYFFNVFSTELNVFT